MERSADHLSPTTGRRKSLWLGVALLLSGCSKPPTTSGGTTPPPPPPIPKTITFVPSSTGLPEQGMWKCDPVLGDVNHDGLMDLAAIPRLSAGPRVWLGDGRGGWTEAAEGLSPEVQSCGGGVDLGDVNGDGHPDLVTADHCNGLFVYLGDGQGKWSMVTNAFTPADAVPGEAEVSDYIGAEDVSVGDVNDDGHLDLLVSASDAGGLDVYLGDGSGRQWQMHSLGLPRKGWANRVMLADMNGDQKLDVVASAGEGPRVWLNDAEQGWTAASEGLSTPVIGGLYHGLAVGDINNDDRPDIAVANWVDGPEAFLQQADGTWQKVPDIFPKCRGGAIGLAVGDLDQDGNLDLVFTGRLEPTGGFVRGVFAMIGDGRGGFTPLTDCGLPDTGLRKTPGVALADVDGDGRLDVAAASGLNVESVPNAGQPVFPQMMLIWRSQPPAGAPAKVANGG